MGMVIKIDVDGVIRDILTPICDIYNNACGMSMTIDDIKEYDVNNIFTKLYDKFTMKPSDYFFNYMSDDVFLNKALPLKGASEAIKRLRENGNKVVIVTYQETLKNKLLTLEFLDKFGIEYDDICFTKDKYLIKGDVLIEDNPHFLMDERDECLRICVDYPYNRHVRLMRVESLSEAVDILLDEY